MNPIIKINKLNGDIFTINREYPILPQIRKYFNDDYVQWQDKIIFIEHGNNTHISIKDLENHESENFTMLTIKFSPLEITQFYDYCVTTLQQYSPEINVILQYNNRECCYDLFELYDLYVFQFFEYDEYEYNIRYILDSENLILNDELSYYLDKELTIDRCKKLVCDIKMQSGIDKMIKFNIKFYSHFDKIIKEYECSENDYLKSLILLLESNNYILYSTTNIAPDNNNYDDKLYWAEQHYNWILYDKIPELFIKKNGQIIIPEDFYKFTEDYKLSNHYSGYEIYDDKFFILY